MQKGPWMDFWGGYPVEKHESHVHYLQRYQEWLDDGKPAPKVLEKSDVWIDKIGSEEPESKPEDKPKFNPEKKVDATKKAKKPIGDSEKKE